MDLRSRWGLVACALWSAFGFASGCGDGGESAPELGGRTEERSPLNCSEGWDPVWSQGDAANNWWVEYAIEDDRTTRAHLEVIGLGVVDLTYEWGKWIGSPSFAIGTGASVILHATNSLGQSAQTRVFGYLVDTLPVTDCIGEGQCVPTCGDRECGSDGCGGTCGACGSGEQCQSGYCASPPEEGGTFQEAVWISGLAAPTTAAFTPDGRLLVAERFGRLRVVKNGALLPTPFLSLDVATQGERGLIGVAVDPDFEANGHVYVYYSYSGGDERGFSRISRFTASRTNPDVAAAGSELVLVNDIPNYIWHNAGALHFGHDGMLYFAVGDNNDRPSAQSLGAITGKIGRIDPSGYPDIIPPDNPFVGVPGAREEVWALGFRNPFTFAVDPESDRIYINDVGDAAWEEINALRRGANYGWARCEGAHLLTSSEPCNDAALTNPLFAYPHEDRGGLFGCSIIGGAFYRGSQFPAQYRGDYFFVDYCERWIARMTPDGQVFPFFEVSWSLITTLLEGPDGALYYVNNGTGNIYRLEYVGGGGNRAPIAVASANPTTGAAPLNVGFDGRDSSDPDGDGLSYTWRFGDGTSATGATASHRYGSAGRYQATLTVSDGNGGTDSASVTVDVAGGTGGGVSITSPADGARYDAGDTLSYRGTAVDDQGNPLPASAYSWLIEFHHDEHKHPFLGPINGVTSGTFLVPTVGEISPNVWYRIHLFVTDGGITREAIRDVHPNVATLTLRTEPAGLTLHLDEGTVTGPHSVGSVTGIVRQLEAPSPQLSGGRWYEFASWSDGGARSHAISTPASDTTYTARFVEVGQPSEEADVLLYDDVLHWNDWSWGTSLSPSASSPVLVGSSSLAVTYATAWAGASLQRDAFDTGAYERLRFAVHPGGASLPAVSVWFHLQGGAATADVDLRDYASALGGGWYQVEIPLADLGATNTTVTRLNLQDLSGAPQGTFHLDDVRLTAGASTPPSPPPPPPSGPAAFLYDDELAWDDWSWGVSLDPGVSAPVYAGARAMALTYTAAWGGVSLHHEGFATGPYSHLVMALRPSSGTLPRLVASLYDADDAILRQVEIRPFATALEGGWYLVEIPLTELAAAGATVTRVQLQEGTGGPLPTLHVDELGFVAR